MLGGDGSGVCDASGREARDECKRVEDGGDLMSETARGPYRDLEIPVGRRVT